jgi:cytochrome c biogenesis protein CcmG/thiol:disulfide interchange protein DsbE
MPPLSTWAFMEILSPTTKPAPSAAFYFNNLVIFFEGKIMKFFTLLTLLASFSINAFAADVNAKAPDFTLESIKNVSANKKISLAELKGKVVYVDFWASWCGPCQRSFPKLEALRNKYKDKGFEVVAINMDENLKDANDFLTKFAVTFPIARDASGKVAEQYNLKGMPSGYIIDQKGVINYISVGFDSKEEKAIEDIIGALTGLN